MVAYGVTPDNKGYGRDDEPTGRLLEGDVMLKVGLDKASPGRGFLWAWIDALRLTLCTTHLKSSRSGNEKENAMKREYVAASVALCVLDDQQLHPAYSQVVIGDSNVGATDRKKIGTDVDVDAIGNVPADRYDDTHALLGGGETYDSNRFRGFGPIDNIYVAGANVANFATGVKSRSTFGSGHFAVSTEYLVP